MNIQLHFDQIRHSPWLDQFLEKRLERLEKFLRPDDRVHLNVKGNGEHFESHLSVQHSSKKFDFSAQGENLFESFSQVLNAALRALSEERKNWVRTKKLK